MCSACMSVNIASYRYCQSCRSPAEGHQPAPRQGGSVANIPEKLQARIDEVRGALANKPGQKQKLRAADSFDAFLRARTEGRRGWARGTDKDVFEWLCWLDSHGRGTKWVHTTDCPGIGTDNSAGCGVDRGCARRYAAGSLDKGQLCKLKGAFSEILGQHEEWNSVERRGNPAASPLARAYIDYAMEEQRRSGVPVKQAPPLLAGDVHKLVSGMRRRRDHMHTAADRFALTRDITLLCVAAHTMQRGNELSIALAAQVMQMDAGRGFTIIFLFGKTLRASEKHSVVITPNTDCPGICAVVALAEYQQAVESMKWDMTTGGGFLFPGVHPDGTKRHAALAPEQMTANLQSHLRLAQLEDHYTMHSFRVGGAVTHYMSGTPFDVLMEFVGWKTEGVARRYVGATPSASGLQAGEKRDFETAFKDANALAAKPEFRKKYSAFRPR